MNEQDTSNINNYCNNSLLFKRIIGNRYIQRLIFELIKTINQEEIDNEHQVAFRATEPSRFVPRLHLYRWNQLKENVYQLAARGYLNELSPVLESQEIRLNLLNIDGQDRGSDDQFNQNTNKMLSQCINTFGYAGSLCNSTSTSSSSSSSSSNNINNNHSLIFIPNIEKIIDIICKYNHRNIIDYIYNRYGTTTTTTTGQDQSIMYYLQKGAIQYGHLELFKDLYKVNNNKFHCATAKLTPINQHVIIHCLELIKARNGSTPKIRHLESDPDHYINVDLSNLGLCSIDILRYMSQNRFLGPTFTPATMEQACSTNNYDVVRFLHETRQEGTTKEAVEAACLNGNLKVIQYLLETVKVPCTTRAKDNAALHSLETFQFVCQFNTGQIYSSLALTHALENKCSSHEGMSIILWIKHRDEPLYLSLLETLVYKRNSHSDCLLYLVANKLQSVVKDDTPKHRQLFEEVQMAVIMDRVDIIRWIINNEKAATITTRYTDTIFIQAHSLEMVTYLEQELIPVVLGNKPQAKKTLKYTYALSICPYGQDKDNRSMYSGSGAYDKRDDQVFNQLYGQVEKFQQVNLTNIGNAIKYNRSAILSTLLSSVPANKQYPVESLLNDIKISCSRGHVDTIKVVLKHYPLIVLSDSAIWSAPLPMLLYLFTNHLCMLAASVRSLVCQSQVPQALTNPPPVSKMVQIVLTKGLEEVSGYFKSRGGSIFKLTPQSLIPLFSTGTSDDQLVDPISQTPTTLALDILKFIHYIIHRYYLKDSPVHITTIRNDQIRSVLTKITNLKN
ncbi:hypothetical protein DFA_02801 [Cavenderia fasciculata]|uniref:Ankyrin repeat-containing protein n=1 Tax=Cavenderia fasciculata TaxID=261658 RepID=F4PIC4_CACFS|nr:uncharacterized protein DFA_02801 [Cavenderia fasciculata]EGG24558.1 hypothetical protein DFA_02801 [Cavenderia fasciculata]|eukprot:XP_004362409.1 hypothetical protein DFA_02801 [Cavenderia fasciculata]